MSQSKKKNLPAMPFYFGDWRKAPEIRALDLDVRMIWFEMLGYMWESSERGYLTINGNPVITPVIARLIGVDIDTMEWALDQMEQLDVFSRREDGAIYSRKMVDDEEKRLQKSIAGRKGMKNRYSSNNKKEDSVITDVITHNENEIEVENENKDISKKVSENQKFKITKSKPIHEHTKELMGYFKIHPTAQHTHVKEVNEWVHRQEEEGNLEYIKEQLHFYDLLKRASGQNGCSWKSWIDEKHNFAMYKELYKDYTSKNLKPKEDRSKLIVAKDYGGNDI